MKVSVQLQAIEKPSEVNAEVAGWDSCKGCHTDSGKPAPSKADLLKKFKTEKELIAAAKRSKNPMMSKFKKDDLLKAAQQRTSVSSKELKKGGIFWISLPFRLAQ